MCILKSLNLDFLELTAMCTFLTIAVKYPNKIQTENRRKMRGELRKSDYVFAIELFKYLANANNGFSIKCKLIKAYTQKHTKSRHLKKNPVNRMSTPDFDNLLQFLHSELGATKYSTSLNVQDRKKLHKNISTWILHIFHVSFFCLCTFNSN